MDLQMVMPGSKMMPMMMPGGSTLDLFLARWSACVYAGLDGRHDVRRELWLFRFLQ